MDAGKQNFNVGGLGRQNQLHHQKANRQPGDQGAQLPEDTFNMGATPVAPAGDEVVASQKSDAVAEASVGATASTSSASTVPTTLSFEIGAPGLTETGPVGVAGLNGLRQLPQADRFGMPALTTINGGPREPRAPVTVATFYGIEHASEGMAMPRLGGGVRSEWGVAARQNDGLAG